MTDVQPTVVDAPGVNPLASQPIAIGELTNVPAPGSLVAAGWAQDTTNRIVHRFPSVAAMNAWAAGNGALAYTSETTNHYRRVAGAWVVLTDANALAAVNTTAINARDTANTANNTANGAQGTANAANGTANAALGTANAAQTAATNAGNAAANAQNGVNALYGQVRYGTQGGIANVSTDGNGDARINYPYGFQSTPGAVAVVDNLANVQNIMHSVDAGGFSIRCFFAQGGVNPNTPWSGATAVNWVASGALLA